MRSGFAKDEERRGSPVEATKPVDECKEEEEETFSIGTRRLFLSCLSITTRSDGRPLALSINLSKERV
jgi:hypothetical protein